MLFVTDRTHAVGPRVAVETAAGGTEHGHVALIGLLGHLSENERFLLRTRHESRQHNVKCEAKTGLIKRLTAITAQCCRRRRIRLRFRLGLGRYTMPSPMADRHHDVYPRREFKLYLFTEVYYVTLRASLVSREQWTPCRDHVITYDMRSVQDCIYLKMEMAISSKSNIQKWLGIIRK